MNTCVPYTYLINFLGVDMVVVLEQRGAKTMVKNITHIRFFPVVHSVSSIPHAPFFVGWNSY